MYTFCFNVPLQEQTVDHTGMNTDRHTLTHTSSKLIPHAVSLSPVEIELSSHFLPLVIVVLPLRKIPQNYHQTTSTSTSALSSLCSSCFLIWSDSDTTALHCTAHQLEIYHGCLSWACTRMVYNKCMCVCVQKRMTWVSLEDCKCEGVGESIHQKMNRFILKLQKTYEVNTLTAPLFN